MIKRLNFTGRRRIPREQIQIAVYQATTPRAFDLLVDWKDLEFPEDAIVCVEATSAGSSAVERYELGTVGTLTGPMRRHLEQVAGERVFFSLKVVDRTEQFGRILGLAEHIRPHNVGENPAAERPGILPIELLDLGPQVWKLDFKDTGVTLFVNQSVPELKDRLRTDPKVYAVIFPEVIRRILERAIANDGSPTARKTAGKTTGFGSPRSSSRTTIARPKSTSKRTATTGSTRSLMRFAKPMT